MRDIIAAYKYQPPTLEQRQLGAHPQQNVVLADDVKAVLRDENYGRLKDAVIENDFFWKRGDFYHLLEKKQKMRCALSGIELTPQTTVAEHKIPLRRGGKHELENIYLLDENVARLKKGLLDAEFVEIARKIVEWHDGSKRKR